jgi:hypothetical protein
MGRGAALAVLTGHAAQQDTGDRAARAYGGQARGAGNQLPRLASTVGLRHVTPTSRTAGEALERIGALDARPQRIVGRLGAA